LSGGACAGLSSSAGDVAGNEAYLRRCLADSLAPGEAPFASHGLYTQPGVLRDDDPEDRRRGIEAGFAWGEVADTVVFYTDHGMSTGMALGLERANRSGQRVEFRTIDEE
jgi:hypothetical protein